MTISNLDLSDVRFCKNTVALGELEAACNANPDLATFRVIGTSEQGRSIGGVTLGYGPRLVTLVAGAHADEPVGPATLRTFVLEALAARDWMAEGGGFADLFGRYTFRIVPHANPDAEAVNQPWIDAWPDLRAFLAHRLREKPGRDVEFGYPVLRAENRAVSRFLFDYSPVALHASLHGMAFSEGALLLIERHWATAQTEALQGLQHGFLAAARDLAGLAPHDQNRSGDKGFRYLGPGFWTTPEGTAMRDYFLREDDPDTAAQFFLSSMEMARVAGYDAARRAWPLCLVTELPLWRIAPDPANPPGEPLQYHAFKARLPDVTARAQRGQLAAGEIAKLQEAFDLQPLDLEMAVRLQLRVLELGLEAIEAV